jgi:hypothetical protein
MTVFASHNHHLKIMLRLIEPTAGVPLHQLKIILNDSKPVIWRRIVAPANLKLNRLHNVFQRAMPWTDSHLHRFLVGKAYYGMPDPEYADEPGPKMLNEKHYTLADIAPGPKSVFIYEYDFGDNWEHIVVVENVLPPDSAFKRVVCLAGENACPPEDCGGIHGYYRMLKILAHPKNEEHESMKEWVGGKWDAKRFDLAKTNAALKRIKA